MKTVSQRQTYAPVSRRDSDLQRYGRPIKKLEIRNAVGPYIPFARSFTKIALSSMNEGTYATAIKDMNAEPKNCTTVNDLITSLLRA